ncbi:DinB family protein [Pseudalkalibacillus sp. R45]|uniref:DinB family protein n=1 Tax=Pseudalkalibacillus sp. R45 TaxID=3457433 RepID=UPI003FCE021C
MNEEQIFEQFRMWRSWTVGSVEGLTEELIDHIPEHHRNNIRWNIGHILAGWDHTVSQTLDIERMLPQQYHVMFPRESSPVDWNEQPPSYEELLKRLKEQPDQMIEVCRGKLDQPLKGEFFHMKTLGEMFLFHMNHEALHMSTINIIKRAAKHQLVK